MGRQDTFSAEVAFSSEVNRSSRGADTVNYITDLLAELHTIANVSGLTHLSEDINSVISKHIPGSAQV